VWKTRSPCFGLTDQIAGISTEIADEPAYLKPAANNRQHPEPTVKYFVTKVKRATNAPAPADAPKFRVNRESPARMARRASYS